MRTYQLVGLLVVASALSFVIGLKVGERRASSGLQAADMQCDCWPQPSYDSPAAAAGGEDAPAIPPIPGLPCIVEFGSDESEACRQMEELLNDLAPQLEGRAGVVIIDTDVHRAEAERWRLRIVPTHVFLDATGEEVSRYEGPLSAEELLAGLRAAGARLEEHP